MALLDPAARRFAEVVSTLTYTNPFSRQRIELEIEALGEKADRSQRYWSLRQAEDADRPNVVAVLQQARQLADQLRDRLSDGGGASPAELRLYEDLSLYVLYETYRPALLTMTQRAASSSRQSIAAPCWDEFHSDFTRRLRIGSLQLPGQHEPAHVFACFFQIRRAFANIFDYIVGTSGPAAALREAVWQSIFTCDLRRYYERLHRCMSDFTTLITGPSGTGKELVARAIGQSRYIAFDPKQGCFTEGFAGSFNPVSLAALSPTLIESELFGHQRGSFTGAVADRAGIFEACPPSGTVFLDEIGELSPAIQVKLLRVLQDRSFQRLGDLRLRHFRGKVIAATHRDLPGMIADGSFREDLYYRLCSDTVQTPTLRQQLDDAPEDLQAMVGFIVSRALGEREGSTAANICEAISQQTGDRYAWPGNFRELEQCVRNILIRGRYTPRKPAEQDALDAALRSCDLTAEELIARYCHVTYDRLGSYVAAGEKLGIDRRTVRRHVQ